MSISNFVTNLKKIPLKLKSIFSPRNLRSVFVLTKKEITSSFSSPLAYIILALFITIVGIIFFGVYRFATVGTSDLTTMFTSIAFAFIIIIPALMMSSISKEKQSGTIEYILTQPLTERHLLISKFVASAIMIFLMLVSTLPIAIYVANKGIVDEGQLVMQYVGAFILGLCFSIVSLSVSTLFKNEITTLIVSIIISALFIVTGTDVLKFLPLELDFLLEKVSLLSHFQSMSRGVLDIRDVLYFIAFILSFFSLAYIFLVKDKYPKNHAGFRKSVVVTVISLVVSVGIGVLGQVIPGRIDFTENNIYTLSAESKKIVRDIDGSVDITLYVSSNLPFQFQSDLRAVQDLLKDFDNAAGNKVNVQIKNPDNDEAAKTEAQTAGIQELVFAVNTDNSTQRTAGFFGIGFKYNEETDAITFVESDETLEFDIAKKIKTLTASQKQVIGVVENNVSHSLYYDYTALSDVLSELYEIKSVTLDATNPTIPEEVTMLIIPGANATFDTQVISNIQKFFESGKSVFLLEDPISVDSTSLSVTKNESSLASLFANYGVTVNTDIVYDLDSNNIVNGGSSTTQIPVRYPLWFIAGATSEDISILKDIEAVSMLWASSISVDKSKTSDITIYNLLQTSSGSNVQSEEDFNLSVNQDFNYQSTDSKKTVAVALQNSKGGKAIVISDSGFVSDDLDQVLRDQNLTFALASVEWLINDSSLSAIKAKSRVAPRLTLSDKDVNVLIASSLGIPITLVLAGGIVRFYLRSRTMRKNYDVN